MSKAPEHFICQALGMRKGDRGTGLVSVHKSQWGGLNCYVLHNLLDPLVGPMSQAACWSGVPELSWNSCILV